MENAFFYSASAPVVSVIVPTYQHAVYIEKCIQGILMQRTAFSVEILIGEDESTDGTREICERLAADNPDRVRLFLGSRKEVIYILGRPTGRANFLNLLRAASGKYIAVCEGDDYWTDPLKLQKQVDFLEANPDCSLCFHRAMLLKGDKLEMQPIPDKVDMDHVQFEDLLSTFNFIATGSVVFRKWKGNSPKWMYEVPFLDLGLHGFMAQTGKIHCINEAMSVYRIHSGGAWTKLDSDDQRKSYLRFYHLISPMLSSAQRSIVQQKRIGLLWQMANSRFPDSPLRQRFYLKYLNFVLYPE